jgi:Fur family peroxide stress response transcriptional regulator
VLRKQTACWGRSWGQTSTILKKPLDKIVIVIIIIRENNSMKQRKHSRKRDAILALIQSSVLHPGAQWVYNELKPKIPDLSLGTVYRNINVFLKEGALASVGIVKGEERFDGRTVPHPHAVCTRCGKVVDILNIEEKTINTLREMWEVEHSVGAVSGFEIDLRKTVFHGVCNECLSTGKEKR